MADFITLFGNGSMPLLMAPMAGVTDRPYRELAREQGCDFTYTEMVSAKAMSYGNFKTQRLMDISGEQSVGIQLFGAEPQVMAAGAKTAQELGAKVIDINMGCPVPKVVGNGEGAALMRNPPLAEAIVKQVVAAVSVPVTVKIRAGWDNRVINAPELAKRLAAAGAAAITVHGRTRAQMYSGKADWAVIEKTAAALEIPVIGNGDVWRAEDILAMADQTGCAGIMLARGVLGNPWLFAEGKAAFQGRPYLEPPLAVRLETALKHFRAELDYRGETKGLLFMRKHLAWYLKGLPQSAVLKNKIYASASRYEVEGTLQDYLQNNR